MALKYFCDRCGQEMGRSVLVQISAEAQTVDRARVGGRTLEVCAECGSELRTLLERKIQRAEGVR